MKSARKLGVALFGMSMAPLGAAQVPDQVTAFDPGGASLGMGGSLEATSSETLSAYYNPAGLAFLPNRNIGVYVRNLPKSFTLSSGQINSRSLNTKGLRGPTVLTHLGFATTPKKGCAVLALTYTLGGEMEDQQVGSGLLNGADTVANYELDRSLRTEYYTLALAKASADQSTSFGVGFNYVRQRTAITEGGVDINVTGSVITVAPIAPVANGIDNGYGYGFTVGLQGTPPSDPNFSWGLSYRSAVDVKGDPHTSQFFSRIPSRALGGVAFRRNCVRGGDNYLILGAQAAYYSGGRSSTYFDRTNQTTVGVGLEYNLARLGGRLPLRVGYKSVPSGGDGFAERNEITYGVGFRTPDGKYAFDANYGSPHHGGYDLSAGLTVRFGQ